MRTPLTLLAAVFATLATAQTDSAQKPTTYLVGYSHLDTEWVWTYRHSILDCVPKTLTENFALFEKYPDYTFNWTGSKRYGFMKEYYPAEYARLKGYIKQGRWVPTGSGIDECDANVPTPESIIRQVLYANRFFKREFGVVSNNYLIPDVFGFPASLPSTLAHAGLKGVSTCKLSYYPDTSAPIPFNVGRWIGPDGASVIGALNCQSYHTEIREDLSKSETLRKRLADEKAKSGLQLDYTYYSGKGDEGGAPDEESVKWLEKSKRSDGPIRIVAKGAGEMYDAITPAQRAALPEYQGELLISKHSAGTASSGATIKRWNHRNELLADAAERAAVAARLLTGTAYPQARLTDAWQRFLGGQMHDILPGTCIPQAYTFAWNDQIIALNESSDVVRASVGAVAGAMDTRAKGTAVVVYNPLASAREDVVEAEVPVSKSGMTVFGPDGKPVTSQRVGGKLLFLAKTPSVGFASYDLRPGEIRQKSALRVSPDGLENERYRVRLDKNGDVASVYDKRAQRELLAAPARLAFMHMKPTRHPAWNMDWDDQKKGPVGYVDGPAKVSVVEDGPVRVALRIEREARGSKFASVVRLSAGSDRVEFLQSIDWRSAECSLKQTFPLSVTNPKATYDCGIGTVQRGNDWEKLYEGPSQRWFDLTDAKGDYGASVLSVAKYGSDKPDDRTLRLTLLYTPGVGGGNYQFQATNDWGHHEIAYALTGHTGDWRGKTPDEAARLVQPLMAFAVPPHAGTLGKSLSFVRTSVPEVGLMAMKKAEDSEETIVRLLERDGKVAPSVKVTFARPVVSARAVDGQENPLPDAVKVENGAVVVDMRAFGPRAIAVRFAPGVAGEAGEASGKTVSLPLNADVTSGGKGLSDGDFDGAGKTLPGELLPQKIESGGIPFRVNAARSTKAAGQKVALPQGRRLYLLAASADGDRKATFLVDGKPRVLKIQAWDGFVGQWDTRLWDEVEEDDRGSGWDHKLLGIAPGFVKRDPIAWYADHRRLADGTNDAYHFAYLFRYAIDLPTGAKTLTLPNDPEIVIVAATVGGAPGDDVRALAPLYDTLEGHPAWKATP